MGKDAWLEPNSIYTLYTLHAPHPLHTLHALYETPFLRLFCSMLFHSLRIRIKSLNPHATVVRVGNAGMNSDLDLIKSA
jgi:hypothetical protein